LTFKKLRRIAMRITTAAHHAVRFFQGALVLIFLARTMAYAVGGTMTGSGTAADPFLVADYADLKVVGTTTYGLSKAYRLIADIDASLSATEHGDSGFVPIGTSGTHFTGAFHGAGHVIKNLTINRPAVDYAGLFGYTGIGAVIDTLGLSGGSVTGGNNTGALIGFDYASTVRGCYATGAVKGLYNVGGLIGSNDLSTISICYATGSVTGTSCVGGCIGASASNPGKVVRDCYATGPATGTGIALRIGGFLGYNSTSTMMESYSSGPAAGGSAVGGFVGENSNSAQTVESGCYWNTETSGLTSAAGISGGFASVGVTGLTTPPMKNASNFSGWSFDTMWTIRADSTYPGLRGIDNAPFAFADTISSDRTVALSRLLLNDCDIETARQHLVLKVASATSGTTDSIGTLTFPAGAVNGAVDTVKYRVGEVRPFDTLWGSRATAFITLDTAYLPGKGTPADPYLVANYTDLKRVGTSHGLGSVYLVIADIDASPSAAEQSGSGFVPVGRSGFPFTGAFHGAGHAIKNLTINRSAANYIGLFGYARGAVIDSLGLSGVSVKGNNNVGGLAGSDSGTVIGCYTAGSVAGTGYVGGLVGFYSSGTLTGMSTCYATCSVIGSNVVGGLVGENYYGTMSGSYATGTVTGGSPAGGLVGYNWFGTVNGSYAIGPVSGSSPVGGLVGYNNTGTISGSYAAGPVSGSSIVGGFVGYNSNGAWVGGCYWNTETSGQTIGAGSNLGAATVTGLTTPQMKQAIDFSGWSFDTAWTIRADSTYPGLRGIDNAPFAFADTFTSGRTVMLSQLLLNDCDIETARRHLTLKVASATSGITDSVSTLTFSTSIANGTIDTVKYRVGEIRLSDTLWGDMATAFITLDTMTTPVKQRPRPAAPKALTLSSSRGPFSPSADISFTLPSDAFVSLKIFDLRGREVATLVASEQLPAGSYTRQWNAGTTPTGLYFCRMRAGASTLTRKVWR
jgi:hypothetical protein